MTYKTTGALGGAVKYTPTLGKKVAFGYTVYDVALVMTKTASSGSADIYIDGVLATRINLRASKTTYRQLVYTKHFTTLGAHTIEIRPIGTGRVDIDALRGPALTARAKVAGGCPAGSRRARSCYTAGALSGRP